MTTLSSISPAKYWRETQNWSRLIGQKGTVIASTLIQFGLPELVSSTPYWLVLIKLDLPKNHNKVQLFLGTNGFSYHNNDRVQCVLRRFSSPGDGLIHYGIKVIPSNLLSSSKETHNKEQ